MSISVENVSKLYGEQKALNKVSFNIKKGEIIGFLGPNGAGKSTMMKIITCFLPQNEGKVSVCGINVLENPIEVKSKIGYLPEHNPLYLEMYVKEYLTYCANVHQLSNVQEKVQEMITLTGLEVEQHKKIKQLSKGYRQRVGLAQAIIHDPEVLILDEPTTGLDPNQLEEIRALIQNIGKSKTVMLSTHIMQEVEAICDRAIIINKGEIIANESIENLTKSGQIQKIIIAFSKSINKDKIKKELHIQSIKEIGSNRFEVTVQNREQINEDIFKWAVENNNSIVELKQKEISIESIFRTLTN